ncbi:uncharacterized protein LOC132746651 [Ruditapes philippinarum]|uniref:uncharacterized protein LOC132746651 n=1 Tax=Ruditapes philippinarum TaxID=129788 RepID=UPI00295B20CE|nr:uncharacterized protein LOC132746651 [Ruditapes philippinarum]
MFNRNNLLFQLVLGCMVFFMGITVQAKKALSFRERLVPVNKRNMVDQNHSSHHRRHPTYASSAQNLPNVCCPSITRKIAPLGGMSRKGTMLQLYRSGKTVQKFYETTCAQNVENKPCMYINQSEWRSVCRQETRYTYAIVKDFNSTDEYRIDYMKINSGCSCTILGPA